MANVMNSDDQNLFGDIEQDNNPSLYGNQSFLKDPYGKNKHLAAHGEAHPPGDDNNNSNNNDFVSNSIVLSNKIAHMVNDPRLQIEVVSSERMINSSVVVYSIALSGEDGTSQVIVKRRYSEFKSLRDNLQKLHPTLVVPPIPEKHTLFTYLVNSINNEKEHHIVDMRKRCFTRFLRDIVFDSHEALRNSELLHKFLDPNYELCWYNAVNEPPVNLIPNNLLLANPVHTTDQNGLYSLLPVVNGFELNSNIDNLNSLLKLNEDLGKLNDQINIFELKRDQKGRQPPEETPAMFSEIPVDLVDFEISFHKNIKILSDMNKLNARSIKNFKAVINNLIELGGNLNNFSLQIHELNTNSNFLSGLIEKFGSTIDSNFLNYELFLMTDLVPEWQEPISQMVQYYVTALQLIKFYKFKIIQYKLVYKLKFNKYQELSSFSNSFQSQVKLDDLKNLDIDSPSINDAIKKIELKQKRMKNRSLSSKKSWYGLFGGNNKPSFNLSQEAFADDPPEVSAPSPQADVPHSPPLTEAPHSPPRSPPSQSLPEATPHALDHHPLDHHALDSNTHYQHKIRHIEKELAKLDQLVDLTNADMANITRELDVNFRDFLLRIEKKWLVIMLQFIRCGKQLFNDNLHNWTDFKLYIEGL